MHKGKIRRGEREYNYTNLPKYEKIWDISLKFNKNKKEENGFLNQVEHPQRIFYNRLSKYINISFSKCKATDAQLGRAPTLRVGSPKGMRVRNSYSSEMRVPSVAHKRGINA